MKPTNAQDLQSSEERRKNEEAEYLSYRQMLHRAMFKALRDYEEEDCDAIIASHLVHAALIMLGEE